MGSAKAGSEGFMRMTDRSLAALKVEPGRKDRLVFDTACPGLGVRVTAKGTRTFLLNGPTRLLAERCASRSGFGET